MLLKLVPVLVLALVFESVYSTEFLFNALKQHVPKIRCRLHKIGSKVIPHMHSQGDPCEDDGPQNHHHGGEFGELNVENPQSGYGSQQLNGHSYGPLSNREPSQFQPNNVYPPTSPKPFVSEFEQRPVDKHNVDSQTGYQGRPGQKLNVDNGLVGGETSNNFVQTSEKNNIKDVDTNELIFDISKSTQNIGNQHSTESYPTSMDIDVRMNVEQISTTARSAKPYATVPTGGGRNLAKVPCKNGMVMTVDGCMEEI